MFQIEQRTAPPESNAFEVSSPTYVQARPRAVFVRGPGQPLRVPRERMIPAQIFHDAQGLVNHAILQATVALREEKITRLFRELEGGSPSLPPQVQKEIQSWCLQFLQIEKSDVQARAFALGILLVKVIDFPACAQWQELGEEILTLIVVDVKQFLEICAEGILEEIEYDEREAEAQILMTALTQEARHAEVHFYSSCIVTKDALLGLQTRREEREHYADEEVARLAVRLNKVHEQLLVEAEKMQQLGEEEEKNELLLEECGQLLQRIGNGSE